MLPSSIVGFVVFLGACSHLGSTPVSSGIGGGAGTPQAEQTEWARPLVDLPAGWIHVPQDWTDVWMGAYHDRLSGAYVRYYLPGANQFRGWEELGLVEGKDRAWEGDLGGIRFKAVRLADARGRQAKLLELKSQTRLEELGEIGQRTAAPPGADLLSVFFSTPHNTITFDGAVCDAKQEERVKDLLLARYRIKGGGERAKARGLGVSDYERLQSGMTFGEVLRMLGVPEASHRVSVDSFAITYFLGPNPGGLQEAILTFDREQQLRGKEAK